MIFYLQFQGFTAYQDLSLEEAVSKPYPLLFIGFPSAKDPTWEQRYPGDHLRIFNVSNSDCDKFKFHEFLIFKKLFSFKAQVRSLLSLLPVTNGLRIGLDYRLRNAEKNTTS